MTIPVTEISAVGASGWLLLRAVLSLGVVLALAVVLLRFVLPRLALSSGRGKRIEVLEVVPVDAKSKLVLVRALDREILVGLGVGGMHPLGESCVEEDSRECGRAAEEPPALAERKDGERPVVRRPFAKEQLFNGQRAEGLARTGRAG